MTRSRSTGPEGTDLPAEWWTPGGARSAVDAALELGDVPLPGGSSAVARASRRRRRPSPHADRSLAWRMCHGLLLRAGRNKLIQRTGVLIAIGCGLAVIILGGVSVIMLNNIVIKRTAELGRLDDTRRQLLVDNALDSAKIAQLSAPTRIVNLALHQYGMVETSVMQQFIWLHPHRGADAGIALRPGDPALHAAAPVAGTIATPATPKSSTAAASTAASPAAARGPQ